ncbi:hypothetical protein B0T19DRAFT_419389 [Cercophora scortea]|uniref:DUF2423 domain-containing protein n=1 Tax=Cercophora scortea TaxID=314031 RepID=A0AAE0MK00_9PEZI|nr:hypothetical protein B0T19DRAFT_419389 [Cercophora scortea]
MAKSARASSNKVNNQKLKKNVFGPVETARLARLSAKVAEIAALPKAPRPVAKAEKVADEDTVKDASAENAETMEVDTEESQIASKKRKAPRAKKSSIVFAKFGEKKISKKRK